MVTLCLALALAAPPGPAAATPAPAPAAEAARSALAKERYPWYDPKTDRVTPVLPRPDLGAYDFEALAVRLKPVFEPIDRFLKWVRRKRAPYAGAAGNLVVMALFLAFFSLLSVGLFILLRKYQPFGGGRAPKDDAPAGGARRIEGLPAGVPAAAADPWAEANRLRGLGDYAGAVVYLFAHQLVTLNRLGQIRLVPGRTGRQLVRTVVDRRLRDAVEPTLRLFEAVYYGRRAPSAEAFEAVWARAEAFERGAVA